jgi:hypothetical protein
LINILNVFFKQTSLFNDPIGKQRMVLKSLNIVLKFEAIKLKVSSVCLDKCESQKKSINSFEINVVNKEAACQTKRKRKLQEKQ